MLGYEEHIKSLKPIKPADLNPKNDILTPDPHTPYLFQPYSPAENQCYVDMALNYVPIPKPIIKKFKKKEYRWNSKIDTFNEGSVDNQGNFVAKDYTTYWHISDCENEHNKQGNELININTSSSTNNSATGEYNKSNDHSFYSTKLNLQEMESGKLKNQTQNVFTPDEMVLKEELGELKNKFVKRVCDKNYVEYERLAKEIANPFFSDKLDEFFDKVKKEIRNTAETDSLEKLKQESIESEHKTRSEKHERKVFDNNTFKGNNTERYSKKQYGIKEVESKFEKMYIRNKKILDSRKNIEGEAKFNEKEKDNRAKADFDEITNIEYESKKKEEQKQDEIKIDNRNMNFEKNAITDDIKKIQTQDEIKTYKHIEKKENMLRNAEINKAMSGLKKGTKNEPKFTKYTKNYETEKDYKIFVKRNATDDKEFDKKIECCEKSIRYLEKHNYKTLKVLAYKIKGKQKIVAFKIIKEETRMTNIDCADFLDMFLRECKMKILSNVDAEGFEIKNGK